MALIARDQDAAEEAALRTCHDCDLLIRLIRDLATVLQPNDVNQLDCSQAELRWLARRAAYVLTFVGASTPQNQLLHPVAAQGATRSSSVKQEDLSMPQRPERGPAHAASTGLTVDAIDLRVRLVPMDGGQADASSHDDRDSDRRGAEVAAHSKPIER